MYDVLIVGGGPAGITAAIYAARAGVNALLIEGMFVGGQAATTSEIENFPGFPKMITGMDFSLALHEQIKNLGVAFKTDTILELDILGETKIARSKKEEYTAKNIILAMGANPKKLGLASELRLSGKGVSYCATCDGAFHKEKHTVVVGGGDTAGEDALYLSKICNKVTVIHRREEFRMQKSLQDRLLNTSNITCLMSCEVSEILGDDSVTGVSLKYKNGETSEIQDISGVFMAVGITPSTTLLPKQLLDSHGYVVADESTKTSVQGVYAAGDIRTKSLRQIITACADGAIALHEIVSQI